MDPTGYEIGKTLSRAAHEVRSASGSLEQRVSAHFEQLREPVYRYLVAAFGDPARSEDIVQESFLQLFRYLHAGNSVANVRAFVFRVAHNLALNQIKSSQFLAPLDDEAGDDLRRSWQDLGPTPEQKLLQQEQWELLRAALATLTPVERQCLHLRSKGLRYREMAEILGLSNTTVAETLYRAIGKLSKENEWTR